MRGVVVGIALAINTMGCAWAVGPLLPEFTDPPRPLVDHHQHLFGPPITAMTPALGARTARDLIRQLDSARIRRAVVMSVAYMYGNPNRPPVDHEYDRVMAENDWTSAQVAAYPDRLVGICSVNPLKEYALAELARCAGNPSLRSGLKMHFGNSDVDLENAEHVERVRAVFRAANERGMAIIVHLRPSVTRKRPYGARIARIFLNELLPAAPNVPVQIAHLTGAGGFDDPLVDQALGVFIRAITTRDQRMGQVYFDISGVAGIGDDGGRRRHLATRIRKIGLERILFGSDAAGPIITELAAFRALPLTSREFRTIETNVAPYIR